MQPKPHPVFLAVCVICIFFNSFLLPEGLLYTTLLTPFFFVSLWRHKGAKVYLGFLLVSLVFALLQLQDVAYLREYLKSFVLLHTVAIFAISCWYGIREEPALNEVVKILSTVNLVLLACSLLCLFIPFLRPYLWYEMSMSEGLPIIPRLKMLTYEASYYAFAITPLFAYYFLKKSLLGGRTGVLLLSLGLSLLVSLSFGVLAALLISIVLVYFLNMNELLRRINLNYLAAGIVLLVAALLLTYWLFPHNMIFERLRNIASGKDTSARGRTYESFILARDIARSKSIWFGIGPGQLKLIGRPYIIQYYIYDNIPAVIRIPNAVAETLNIFGLCGIVLRFGIILFLFIRTRVWHNYYRLLLFLFVFIYQFTGSFLFNVLEYVVWALAFSPALFPCFDRRHFLRKTATAG